MAAQHSKGGDSQLLKASRQNEETEFAFQLKETALRVVNRQVLMKAV
jgi:hypothetical protein